MKTKKAKVKKVKRIPKVEISKAIDRALFRLRGWMDIPTARAIEYELSKIDLTKTKHGK